MNETEKLNEKLDRMNENINAINVVISRMETSINQNVIHRLNKLEEKEEKKTKLLFGVLTPLVVKFIGDLIRVVS